MYLFFLCFKHVSLLANPLVLFCHALLYQSPIMLSPYSPWTISASFIFCPKLLSYLIHILCLQISAPYEITDSSSKSLPLPICMYKLRVNLPRYFSLPLTSARDWRCVVQANLFGGVLWKIWVTLRGIKVRTSSEEFLCHEIPSVRQPQFHTC